MLGGVVLDIYLTHSNNHSLDIVCKLTAKSTLAIQKPYYAQSQNIFYGIMPKIQKQDFVFSTKRGYLEK
jgi:DNA-binding transcriptional MocR family regulator